MMHYCNFNESNEIEHNEPATEKYRVNMRDFNKTVLTKQAKMKTAFL